MKASELVPGRRYEINFAPLIASPQPSKSTFKGVVHHVNGETAYVFPDNGGTPLYIHINWFIKEGQP